MKLEFVEFPNLNIISGLSSGIHMNTMRLDHLIIIYK